MRSFIVVTAMFLLVLGVGFLTSGALLCVLVATTGNGDALLYGMHLSAWWKGLLAAGAVSFVGGVALALWVRRPVKPR